MSNKGKGSVIKTAPVTAATLSAFFQPRRTESTITNQQKSPAKQQQSNGILSTISRGSPVEYLHGSLAAFEKDSYYIPLKNAVSENDTVGDLCSWVIDQKFGNMPEDERMNHPQRYYLFPEKMLTYKKVQLDMGKELTINDVKLTVVWLDICCREMM
jgi:hypothetical protein